MNAIKSCGSASGPQTHPGILGDVLHDFLPAPVDVVELFALFRQLLPDVFGVKDRLQIEPLRLHLWSDEEWPIRESTGAPNTHEQSLVDDLLHTVDLVLPLQQLRLEGFDVNGVLHGECLDDVIVKQRLNVLTRGQDGQVSLFVKAQCERQVLPLVFHLH